MRVYNSYLYSQISEMLVGRKKKVPPYCLFWKTRKREVVEGLRTFKDFVVVFLIR